jgi:DNA/RNA-binding domain of Phe-tRNA-synthetase-like protein
MQTFYFTREWREAYPGAHAGILVVRNAAGSERPAGLERVKEALVLHLRQRFGAADRAALAGLPVLQAYNAYYKRFKKTYHVQHQLESVVWKGREIPRAAGPVEAMFMAELENLLLTAGHDLDTLQLPVCLDLAKGDETYTLLRGVPATLKAGDMFMADRQAVISSILYGPDARTRITADTRHVLFAVYAPQGIEPETIRAHLEQIASYLSLLSPQAEVVLNEVYG